MPDVDWPYGDVSLRGLQRSAACHVDRAEAFRYLGYADQALSEDLRGRIECAFALCEDVGKPAWTFRAFPVEVSGGIAYLRGSSLSFRVDATLRAHARMSMCAVMACTIGLAFDREERRLSVAQTTEAVIFDAAGSSLAESCAAACEAEISRQAARAGLHAGQRTSPGYGDLPLSLSREIVSVLDAGKQLGISVADSGLLAPMKSVTALVGLFDEEEDARLARRSCADCIVRDNCPYLRSGNPCNAQVDAQRGSE